MKKLFYLAAPLFLILSCSSSGRNNWQTAFRGSAGIAPEADQIQTPIVQIYGARAYSWRGWFSLHCWIAYKLPEDKQYKVAQVIGWRLYGHDSSVAWKPDLPDRYWWGAEPQLISDLRGEDALKAIPKIEELIKNYPHAGTYRVWPGPNSNSFISHIIREVPELKVELPPHAIGKDWITNGRLLDWSPSGTGFQLSLLGVAGVTIGLSEGFEINLLGLNFGLDFLRPALKLPFIGRLGMKDK